MWTGFDRNDSGAEYLNGSSLSGAGCQGGSSLSGSGGGLCGGSNMQRQVKLIDTIEGRISRMESDLKRLRDIKKQLSEPHGAMAVTMEDLRFVMGY